MKLISLIIILCLLFIGIMQIGYTKPSKTQIAYAKVTSYKKMKLGEETFSLFEVNGMKCLYKKSKTLVRNVNASSSTGYAGGSAMYMPTEVLSCVSTK